MSDRQLWQADIFIPLEGLARPDVEPMTVTEMAHAIRQAARDSRLIRDAFNAEYAGYICSGERETFLAYYALRHIRLLEERLRVVIERDLGWIPSIVVKADAGQT